MGTCSGHGKGAGAIFQPGHGGGFVPGWPHQPLSEKISKHTVMMNEPVCTWKPTAQLPLAGGVTNVVINKKIPIVDKDALIPPTEVIFTTQSIDISVSLHCQLQHIIVQLVQTHLGS